MSPLSEHTGNGNSTETRLQREETKEQIDGLLQHFDVLPSRFDRFLFRYIYVYLLGLFFLAQLLNLIYLLARNSQVGGALQAVGLSVLPMVATISVIWRFNVWRSRTPKTLRDLLENKRISLPAGEADPSYLGFLEHYRDALASPKRYFLSGFWMIGTGILFASAIVQTLSSEPPNNLLSILLVGNLLLLALLYLGGGILYRNTDMGNVHLGPVRQETAASLPAQHSALSPRPVRWPQAARQFLFWLRFTTADRFWTLHWIHDIRSFGVFSTIRKRNELSGSQCVFPSSHSSVLLAADRLCFHAPLARDPYENGRRREDQPDPLFYAHTGLARGDPSPAR